MAFSKASEGPAAQARPSEPSSTSRAAAAKTAHLLSKASMERSLMCSRGSAGGRLHSEGLFSTT